MKMSNGFEREGLQKTLPRAIPMQTQKHPKSNRQKAVCYGKWSESLLKRNCPAPIVTNWYRFGIALAVLAHWAATFRTYFLYTFISHFISKIFPLNFSLSPNLKKCDSRISNSIFLHLKCSKKLSASIYSDSDSTDKEKTDNTASDSQNHTFRTKAALKEFNSHQNSAAGKASNRTNKDTSSSTTNLAKDKERLEAEKERLQDSYESDHQKPRKADKTQKERQEKTAKLKEKGREKQEKERLQREKAEKERLAKIEQERIEKEAAEKERIERLQTEKVEKSKDKKKRKDVSKDFPTDLLVVPQRQAAKKASENMMRTQAVGASKKEQSREDENKKELPKELNKIKDRRDSSKDSGITKETTIKQKGKSSKSTAKSMTQTELPAATSPINEIVATKEKDVKSKKADKVDKNLIVAYVPQRQAAKKAAEHIKGLGKVVTTDPVTTPAAAPVAPAATTNILTKSSSKHSIHPRLSHSQLHQRRHFKTELINLQIYHFRFSSSVVSKAIQLIVIQFEFELIVGQQWFVFIVKRFG